MVAAATEEGALVKVLSVRVQNRNGAIFRGQRITSDGQIVDTHNEVTVRLQAKGVGTRVMPGQWWQVRGQSSTRTFVNSGGFEVTEDQIEVAPGHAEIRLPSGAHIVDYLIRNPRFEGVGQVTAERLWETFKDRLVEVLDQGDYQALVDVVSPAKTAALIEGWRAEGLSKTLQWLQASGVGLALGRRILDYFGAEAVERINENPYRLLSFSVGWFEVDKLALGRLGLPANDDRRLAAAVEEVVYRRFSLGDTFVPRATLAAGLRSLLKAEHTTSRSVNAAIELSESTRRLLFDKDGNAYSLGASILENQVVDAIVQRRHLHSPACAVDAIIQNFESRSGFALNQEQRDAVHLVADHHFTVVTGGAGCGKTTVLLAICDLLEAQGYEVTQLALAGKAAKRMTESTGRPASTIASYIKRMREAAERDAPESSPQAMALIIDEASMVDLISFSSLTRLVGCDTKIVLVGDPSQLPPVGPGLILHCLASFAAVPHVQLRKVNRFGADIATVADSIRQGNFPEPSHFTGCVEFAEADESEMTELACALYLQRPTETVVLTATNRLADAINSMLQATLTKGNRPLRQFNLDLDVWEHLGFHEGDLLLCTQNHWDLGVMNGSLGRLINAYEEPRSSGQVPDDEAGLSLGRIEWDDGVVRELRDNLLDSLKLGYALTVHKSQGSQWNQVIVCLPMATGSHASSVDRSMIYTAVTRAQQRVTIFGRHAELTRAVQREMAANRRLVGLPKRLASHAAFS